MNMKRFVILVSALTLLMPLHMSAQVSMAAGVGLGVMDGAGIGVAFGVSDALNIRAGVGLFPNGLIKEYDIDLPKWGSNPATSTALTGKLPSSGNILVDYHPGGGSFRLTAGAFVGSGSLVTVYNTKALPDSYHNVGISYYADGNRNNDDPANFYRIQADEKGVLNGTFKASPVRPYVGIGFGSAIPRGRVGAAFDLGLEYTGGLDLRADARNIKSDVESLKMTSAGVLETVKLIRGYDTQKSYDKYIDYVDKLRSVPVLPVMRISVFVKLF